MITMRPTIGSERLARLFLARAARVYRAGGRGSSNRAARLRRAARYLTDRAIRDDKIKVWYDETHKEWVVSVAGSHLAAFDTESEAWLALSTACMVKSTGR